MAIEASSDTLLAAVRARDVSRLRHLVAMLELPVSQRALDEAAASGDAEIAALVREAADDGGGGERTPPQLAARSPPRPTLRLSPTGAVEQAAEATATGVAALALLCGSPPPQPPSPLARLGTRALALAGGEAASATADDAAASATSSGCLWRPADDAPDPRSLLAAPPAEQPTPPTESAVAAAATGISTGISTGIGATAAAPCGVGGGGGNGGGARYVGVCAARDSHSGFEDAVLTAAERAAPRCHGAPAGDAVGSGGAPPPACAAAGLDIAHSGMATPNLAALRAGGGDGAGAGTPDDADV